MSEHDAGSTEDPTAREERLRARREKYRRDPDRYRGYRRAAMEKHGEEIREYKRQWQANHKEHVSEYHRRYHEEHRDYENARNRAYMRRRAAERRQEQELAERRRVNAREYYVANRDRIAMATRAWRGQQKLKDPEGYLAQRRESNKRWRDKNKDRENAKLRAQYRDNAPELREKARAYYAANRERILAQRKAAREASPDSSRERQRRYRERERRRREAGLPPYRRHRTTAADRAAHRAEADAFFARPLTPERLTANLNGPPTPPELIAWWQRDCARARATEYLAIDPGARVKLNLHVSRRSVDQVLGDRKADVDAAVRASEEARMDAIGRRVNNQLRTGRRRTATPDPAAPHTSPSAPHAGGLSR
ncbi:hypothetical protein [Microbacterium sp.]|uniref:hypothetical protein n=1 Tax=Microbacterium sp. TaxID=51671 RepID=UPI003F71F02E